MNPAAAVAKLADAPPLRTIRWRMRETGREARVMRVVSDRDRDLVYFRYEDEIGQRGNERRATARQFLADMERV